MLVDGAEIRIGSDGHAHASARATAFRRRNGQILLVTCGHAFTDGHDQVISPDSGLVVAELLKNLYPQRDLAFARLTDAGRQALGPIRIIPTGPPGDDVWIVRSGRKPVLTAVHKPAHHGAPFVPRGPYILTHYRDEAEGDSGAPLLTKTPAGWRLCGLLRGFARYGAQFFGHYTPLGGAL